MSLFTILQTIISLILRFWRRIPPDARKKIIAAIVTGLEELIREFYRRYKQK